MQCQWQHHWFLLIKMNHVVLVLKIKNFGMTSIWILHYSTLLFSCATSMEGGISAPSIFTFLSSWRGVSVPPLTYFLYYLDGGGDQCPLHLSFPSILRGGPKPPPIPWTILMEGEFSAPSIFSFQYSWRGGQCPLHHHFCFVCWVLLGGRRPPMICRFGEMEV